ncbi:xanthomonadin biosynthesis protein [Dyella solisilvae]|uniref:Xanthomonadin biosynthesis protein n=1 Tax=Dyella solisilvae TaxID=1920168 RepID=A0A370K8B0_9GAMM|nr:xanthomonadin biosynthesis protein [Dyella solisilvae]RDI98886.1 xanthomonadin biosynthesis protein [Dyella solisilvae]
MSSSSALPPKTTPRRWMALWFAYPVLALAGMLTHQQGYSLAACALLLTLLMAPALATRRPLPWLAWTLLLAAMGWLWLHGMVGLLLECVPIAINVLLASLFGRSLRAGSMPLIARFIEAVEGPERLLTPGVATYARQLTWFWTLLTATQALVLAVLLLCAEPGGLLAQLGVASPWPVPAGPAQAYVHFGGYGLIAAAFLLEHGFRRWRLRHVSHPRFHELALGIAARWPQLVRGQGPAAP